jgi:hypothetical protein
MIIMSGGNLEICERLFRVPVGGYFMTFISFLYILGSKISTQSENVIEFEQTCIMTIY